MTRAELTEAVEKAQEAKDAAVAAQKVAEDASARAQESAKERWPAIWLEVSEVRYVTLAEGTCSVLLKADKEQPKPIWWPVNKSALGKEQTPFDIYKAILHEMDKKRMVLVRLSCDPAANNYLHCDSFRFQSPELGSR
jgi:hypothetical protein